MCRIPYGKYGHCGARQNIDGVLYVPYYGVVIAQCADPVEKKPLFHFLPGSKTYSIASPGCNFTCSFCQNWEISQHAEDKKPFYLSEYQLITPEKLVENAIHTNCKSIAFTYTEPTVFYEFMKDVATIALTDGIRCVVVSNGYMSSIVLEELHGIISAYNIDLKSFSDNFYVKFCGAHLNPVLETIKTISRFNSWLEITTLIIPEENDSDDELNEIAAFIASVDRNIPWHVSRFFPRYKCNDKKTTSNQRLCAAVEAGKRNGLKYVYCGNTSHDNVTACSFCNDQLITRNGYETNSIVSSSGLCPQCGTAIPGIWK